jgi:hypothetical protein
MNEYYLLRRWLPCCYHQVEQLENVAIDRFLPHQLSLEIIPQL